MFTRLILCTAVAIAEVTNAGPTTTAQLESDQTSARKITAPPDFVECVDAGREAFCSPSERSWVASVLSHQTAATRPASSAGSIGSNFIANRAAMRSMLVEQLGLSSPVAVDTFLDQPLTQLIARLQGIRVHIIYLVASRNALKSIVASGWGSDQFRYNRVADKIIFDGEVTASIENAGNDSLVPVIYQEDESPEQRSTRLREDIQRTESGIAVMISRESQRAVESAIGEFALREGLVPLKLDNDEDWFNAGVVGVVSANAMRVMSGDSSARFLAELTEPNRLSAVKIDSIDLAHPVPREQLRPQLIDDYADTFRRRSVKVVSDLLAAAGPDALGKTLQAIAAAHPADNAALLAIIRQQTGIDLSTKLQPQM